LENKLRKLTEKEISALCRGGKERTIRNFCESMGDNAEAERKRMLEWAINTYLTVDTALQLNRAIDWASEENIAIT